MNDEQKNPLIEWCNKQGNTCLRFTFKGTFRESEALVAVKEWKEHFASMKGEKILLIWQCLGMKGYEPMARSLWQTAIKELKPQIECIWLVTDSHVIQAGAAIMSLFTSFPIKTVKTEEKILL